MKTFAKLRGFRNMNKRKKKKKKKKIETGKHGQWLQQKSIDNKKH